MEIVEISNALTLKLIWTRLVGNGPVEADFTVVTNDPLAKSNKRVLSSDISPAAPFFQLGDVYQASAKDKKELWMVGKDGNTLGFYQVRDIAHATRLHEELQGLTKDALGMEPPKPVAPLSKPRRLAA